MSARLTAHAVRGSSKIFDVERIEDGASGVSIGPRHLQRVQLRLLHHDTT